MSARRLIMSSFQEDSALLRRAFVGALQRDPEERAAFLDAECAGRPDLRELVDALLEAHKSGRVTALPVTGDPAKPESVNITSDAIPVGRQIGNYVIRKEVGRGGMGVVYLADDLRLSRPVALKAVGPWATHTPGLRERLRHEAQAAAGLSHPGIATVYALEEIDGELYVAYEFVPGAPLRAHVKSGPLPIEQVVDIGVQVARALAEAHTRGIVHRDIKPENVIQTPSGVAKILDFGLARVENSPLPRLTQTGMIVGTPAYMSPEQLLGQEPDFRTDIFALGLLLYELASGVNPFVDTTPMGTLARIIGTDPPPLSSRQPRSVPDLDRIIATCLNKDPARRYGSTQALVEDLQQVQVELSRLRSGSAGSVPLPPPRQSSSRLWLVIHQLAVSAVYAGMLVVAWVVRRWIDPPWSLAYVFVILALAAIAISLRLHLAFTARAFPQEFVEQQAITAWRTRACDAIFALAQWAAAAYIGPAHPEFAMLLVGVSSAVLVASIAIEPATARAGGSAPAS